MNLGELVNMDNRFLGWLSDPDEYATRETVGKHRFITIHDTEDCEIDIKEYNSLDTLKKSCIDTIENQSGW